MKSLLPSTSRLRAHFGRTLGAPCAPSARFSAGAWLGFRIADPIFGLLITVAILFLLRGDAREATAG
jgi:hypothetical protein